MFYVHETYYLLCVVSSDYEARSKGALPCMGEILPRADSKGLLLG